MALVNIPLWGPGAPCPLIRVRVTPSRGAVEAVCDRLSKSLCLQVRSKPRADGLSVRDGKPHARHYEMILGKLLSDGSFASRVEIWFAVPVTIHWTKVDREAMGEADAAWMVTVDPIDKLP
jgi:hypothetical protein